MRTTHTFADLGVRAWRLQGGDPDALLAALAELLSVHTAALDARTSASDAAHRARCDVRSADAALARAENVAEQRKQEAGALAAKVCDRLLRNEVALPACLPASAHAC